MEPTMCVREEMLAAKRLREHIPDEEQRMEAWFRVHDTPTLRDWDTEGVKPFPSAYGFSVIPNWAFGYQH